MRPLSFPWLISSQNVYQAATLAILLWTSRGRTPAEFTSGYLPWALGSLQHNCWFIQPDFTTNIPCQQELLLRNSHPWVHLSLIYRICFVFLTKYTAHLHGIGQDICCKKENDVMCTLLVYVVCTLAHLKTLIDLLTGHDWRNKQKHPKSQFTRNFNGSKSQ